MKKFLLLGMSLVMAFSLLTACGGGEEAAPEAEAPAAEDAAGEEAPAEEAGTVVMPVSGVEIDKAVLPTEEFEINFISPRMGVIEAYAEAWEQLDGFENYSFNAVFDQNYLQTQSLAMSAGGDNSYQIMGMSASNFGVFSQNDWLYDLSPFIEKYSDIYNLADIPESMWEDCTVDGKVLGVPTTTNMLLTFYREDIFAEEGLTVPTTYDELIALLDTLVGLGYEYPYVTALGFPNALEIEFMNMMHAVGGDFFDAETNAPLFNSEKGLESLERIYTLYTYMNPDALNWNSDDLTIDFQTGQSVIAQTWGTRSANMEDPSISQVVGLVGYAPSMSVYDGNPLNSYIANDYFIIPYNIGSEEKAEAAFVFMMEALSEPSQQVAGAVSMTSRSSALSDENVSNSPQYPAMLESIELGLKPFVSVEFPFYGQINSLLGPYLSEALANNEGLSAEERTAKFQEALDKAEADSIVLLQDLGYME